MTKKHAAVFDDVLSGLGADAPPKDRAGTRFLQRSARVSERMSGEIEELTLRRIDPARARMWERHNRAYDLLTEDNCRDLIDGIRSQGKQEFPAIVRATGDAEMPYEVICGARRHFAVSWLRANNYPDVTYLIEVRDLTDEEAFRLADIENRDREDLSDYERAVDYLDALDRYYHGSQKDMAARLEISPAYLSRFLQLARLPAEIVAAFPGLRDIRELHARTLKPLLGTEAGRRAVLAEARAIAAEAGRPDAGAVIRRLTAAAAPKKPAARKKTFARGRGETGITVTERSGKTILEFDSALPRVALEECFSRFLDDRHG